jgi:hypothetical protein
MITIDGLNSEAAMQMWSDLAEYVDKALAHDLFESISIEKVERQIREGFALVYVAHEDGEMLGVTVVQLYNLKGERIVHLLTTTGVRMDEWQAGMIAAVVDLAERQKASSVTMAGRPGWARSLRQYGFRQEQVAMRLRIGEQNGINRQERTAERAAEPGDIVDVCEPATGAVFSEPIPAGREPGEPAARADSAAGERAQSESTDIRPAVH